MSARRSRVVGGIAALPAIALAVASLWWSAGAIRGNGLWPPDDVTLSEAIATRNNAEALRLIALGANPNVPSRVRDGMLTYGYDVTMRPLEAAVGAQREDSLRLLLEHGAKPGMTDEWGVTPLDLARKRGFDDLAAVIERHL